NMGDREAFLRSALDKLDSPELQLRKTSNLYETEPIGFREQGWFLNMAAEFETDLFPKQLLRRIQRVELQLGRKRLLVNGPRTIDIDVLLYGNSVIRTNELEVPHPRFRERRFVLEPLAELNPGLRDPVTGRTMAELLAQVSGQKLHVAGTSR
ncbi:MAG TPA: 2-amino-4-hydroxy-6-hydroxymethyldihydropteridine diphosphokinase, partial [Bryobacteraceae bacterium]|nr:2-amino-4-hydroxy-6-hydroxymethyldihydropteridine diphosphokinase [Bryobacteraceae bacterium]